MKKHLLVTYAWSINNIGDMGIQAGLMTLLREKCPGLPVKLMSYLPENDYSIANSFRMELEMVLTNCPECVKSDCKSWRGRIENSFNKLAAGM